MKFYATDDGKVFCDPCSLKFCAANHSEPLHRTYKALDLSNTPTLTCDMCGGTHAVAQS